MLAPRSTTVDQRAYSQRTQLTMATSNQQTVNRRTKKNARSQRHFSSTKVEGNKGVIFQLHRNRFGSHNKETCRCRLAHLTSSACDEPPPNPRHNNTTSTPSPPPGSEANTHGLSNTQQSHQRTSSAPAPAPFLVRTLFPKR